MHDLTIFVKRASTSKYGSHLIHGSSMIRCEQVATHKGAKLNPEKGYEVDAIGTTGAPGLITKLPTELKSKIVRMGFKLITYSNFHKREDMVDFYQKIDKLPTKINVLK